MTMDAADLLSAIKEGQPKPPVRDVPTEPFSEGEPYLVEVVSEGLVRRVERLEDQFDSFTETQVIRVIEETLELLGKRVRAIETTLNGS